MVIHAERSREEQRIVAALRSVFDASVLNFGSYNLLYARNLLAPGDQADPAEPSGSDLADGHSVQEAVARAGHLLVGYRREPLELVLCPLDADLVLGRMGEYDDAVELAEVPALLNLTNLAGMATDGSQVEIAFSTGRRVTVEVSRTVTFTQVPGIALTQDAEVEDFYDFLEHFMDRVEHR